MTQPPPQPESVSADQPRYEQPVFPTDPVPSPGPGPSADPAPEDEHQAPAGIDVPRYCPGCGIRIAGHEQFCENCGLPLVPTVEQPEPDTERGSQATRRHERAHVAAVAQCRECGGEIDEDGYCATCGARAADPRDHFEEAPAPWVAGVCDRGVRHERNEDAMALAVDDDGRAIMIVCDGVSTSEDSDIASLAGARAARARLLAPRSPDTSIPPEAALAADLTEATFEANAAVVAHTRPESGNAASCTFVAAVVQQNHIDFAHLGDSRVYWFGADGDQRLLTLDDSVAQARIEMGVAREVAETGFQAHAITRWLGRDSQDVTPHIGAADVTGPGWVLVCSDGLWNYASEPAALWAQLAAALGPAASEPDPLKVARSLVAWANQQGGRDNITVALALLQPKPAPPEPVQTEE